MYTPDFEKLFTEFFLPSLKDDFKVVVKEYPQDCASGSFRSEGWDKTMLNKLKLLREAILDNWNQIFFYSDVDIIFLRSILDTSLEHLGEHDFVVQQGWPRNTLCAGFFVMRGNENNLKLITKAYTLLDAKICIDDQLAIQKVLENSTQNEIAWKLLPADQYPNGRRVLKKSTGHYLPDSEIEISDAIILFHANCCIGLENKYHFLKRVQEEFQQLTNSSL